MSKHELVIPIPSVVLSKESAERIYELLIAVAEEKVLEMVAEEARVLNAHMAPVGVPLPAGQPTVEEILERLVGDPAHVDLTRRTHGAKFTFLSPKGSFQFVGEEFEQDDIPKDLDAVIAEARGGGERWISIQLKARTLQPEVDDPAVNRVLIQSSVTDRAWANDVYNRLKQICDAEENFPRHLVYGYMPAFVWPAFLSVVILQYKVVHALAGFSWRAPLNGLELLLATCVLAADLLLTAWAFQRFLHFALPFFKVEGNVSRRRIAWRTPLRLALTALYGSGVVYVFKFLVSGN